jgi:nucleoside-diphosphate-sugar epimerase
MRVLVTGANGFVGAALCAKLKQIGHYFVPSVRRSYGIPDEKLVGEIDGDTCWSDVLKDCEAVVHLAARVHVNHEKDLNSLLKFRTVNVDGTTNLARSAAAAGVKRFIYLSTIKVNGESTEIDKPFSADDPTAPSDTYSLSKWEAEQELWKISQHTQMELVIIRPPLVYGPGVKANFLALMTLLGRGVPLPLASVTSNRRSLVALDNLVDLIATCLVHPNAANQTFLVSDGEDLSTAELILRMSMILGRPVNLFHVPLVILRLGATILGKLDLYQRLCCSLHLDISKTTESLNWLPPINLNAGLLRILNSRND